MNLQEKINVDKQAVPRAMVFFAEGKFYAGYERTAYLATRLLPPLKVNCRYSPGISTAFIICEPKQREVFAASFRDRVVHHLYYNYVHRLFERTFIADSYSCIKGRGTHYGVDRLEHHIRSESRNYSRPCYVLKMDIESYFRYGHAPIPDLPFNRLLRYYLDR